VTTVWAANAADEHHKVPARRKAAEDKSPVTRVQCFKAGHVARYDIDVADGPYKP
jgi:hypothetical protein